MKTYTSTAPSSMTTTVQANDESYARHLAMIRRWGLPTGVYGPDYKGQGLSLVEPEQKGKDHAE